MNKRNSLPLKPMIWILAVLLVVVFWMPRTSKNTTPTTGQHNPSQNNPAQLPNSSNPSSVGTITQNQNTLSTEAPKATNTENGNLANGKNTNVNKNINQNVSPSTNPSVNAPGSGETNAAAGDQNNASGPVANPIPTDAQVLQNIAQQNQRQAQAYSVMASRAALAAQVQQSAAISRYQNVAAEDIPASDITPPSADAMAKIKAHQLGVSH